MMTNPNVPKVQQFGHEVHLYAQRIPGLHAAVRELGGVAGPGAAYVFPIGSLSHVHDLCERLYGNRGYVEFGDVMTVRIDLGQLELNPWYAEQQSNPEISDYTNAIRIGGRLIAVRPWADAGVHLGDGVELAYGEFEPAAGEPGAPMLGRLDDVVVHVLDLLRIQFDALPSYAGMEILQLHGTDEEISYDVLREQARVSLYAKYLANIRDATSIKPTVIKPIAMDSSA